MPRDGVKMLWCHSHLVWLVFEGFIPTCTCFIQKTFCDLFLLLFCLYCCVYRNCKREESCMGGQGVYKRKISRELHGFVAMAWQSPRNTLFHQFAKVFSLKNFFVHIKQSPLFQMLPSISITYQNPSLNHTSFITTM